MPNKIRYLFGPPLVTGADARRALEKILAECRKNLPEEKYVKEFKPGKDWKALVYNFSALKRAGHLSKAHYLKVWRDRTHLRTNNSPYRGVLSQVTPKPQPGTWNFTVGTWYYKVLAWAIPLLEGAGFYIKYHPENEDNWRIVKVPVGYPHGFVYIVNKKVLSAKAVGNTPPAYFVGQ